MDKIDAEIIVKGFIYTQYENDADLSSDQCKCDYSASWQCNPITVRKVVTSFFILRQNFLLCINMGLSSDSILNIIIE